MLYFGLVVVGHVVLHQTPFQFPTIENLERNLNQYLYFTKIETFVGVPVLCSLGVSLRTSSKAP